MNFEKLIVKNKKSIMLFLIIFLAIALMTTPNKIHFLYGTPLGRAYLIALLIIVTGYNKYLGLVCVALIVLIYNSTDSIIENMENKSDEDKKDDKKEEKKEDSNPFSSALSAVSAATDAASASLEGKKDETTDDKKSEKFTVGQKVEMEDSIKKPKESFSLMSIPNLFKANKEPRPNWSDGASYGLGFAPAN